MTDTTIAFLHIPKTAGSSITRALEKLVPREFHFKTGDNGRTHYENNFIFAALPEKERRRYRLITGHLELVALQNVPPPVFAFTILRHPVRRMNSLYHYIRHSRQHHLYSWVTDNNISLADFMNAGAWHELDNGMVRRLSGAMDLAPYGQCSREMLRVAERVLLRGLSFFGLQENLDASLFLLGHLLGLDGPLDCGRSNVTPNKPKSSTLSSRDMEAIERYNALDLQLHETACQAFGQRYIPMLKTARERFRRLGRNSPGQDSFGRTSGAPNPGSPANTSLPRSDSQAS